MLSVASSEAMRERKEEVRGVTSWILRILEEDTELVANATRTTHQQLYCAFVVLRYDISNGAVAEGLVPKLRELHYLTRDK